MCALRFSDEEPLRNNFPSSSFTERAAMSDMPKSQKNLKNLSELGDVRGTWNTCAALAEFETLLR